MTLATKLKSFSRIELASIAFYSISGIILLASLFLTSFAPQLGLLGIISLIVAYGLFTKRDWAPWLLFILFVAATTFSLYTLYAGRIQQFFSRYKHGCLCSAYMGVCILRLIKEKNPLNFTSTAEKHNSDLLIYIDKLFIFRNLDKPIRFGQSGNRASGASFHGFSKQTAFFIEF